MNSIPFPNHSAKNNPRRVDMLLKSIDQSNDIFRMFATVSFSHFSLNTIRIFFLIHKNKWIRREF